jgi:carboxypeptidase Taq
MNDAPLANSAYSRLAARFARIATVREAASVLDWDASAMMPAGGGAARGEQLAVLAGIAHGMLIEPAAADDLAAAEAEPAGDAWEAENLRLMRHAHIRATALPADLVEALARASSDCEKIWRVARAASDFASVREPLAGLLRLVRESAAALAPVLGLSPYDALMDDYQRGVTSAKAGAIFDVYEAFLRENLGAIEERQRSLPAQILPRGPFPIPAQEALAWKLAQRLGLEPDHARLDSSAHPFCGGTPTDVRITSRYNEGEALTAMMSVLHETGHALYERGLPEAWARQPVGQAAGMAVHESQSLIMEMQTCRSDAFLHYLGRELHASFGGDAAPYAAHNLARLLRHVHRGHIRVDADEVTYPAHVILRFRLEQAMLSGDLQVADLPGAWREQTRALLGNEPPDDRRGCLQDIHWYCGLFGYFPSYTLGAMGAAQLMAAARRALPGLDAEFAEGDVSGLLGWLRREVHARASLLGMDALMEAATGKPLDPSDFLAHLRARYL